MWEIAGSLLSAVWWAAVATVHLGLMVFWLAVALAGLLVRLFVVHRGLVDQLERERNGAIDRAQEAMDLAERLADVSGVQRARARVPRIAPQTRSQPPQRPPEGRGSPSSQGSMVRGTPRDLLNPDADPPGPFPQHSPRMAKRRRSASS